MDFITEVLGVYYGKLLVATSVVSLAAHIGAEVTQSSAQQNALNLIATFAFTALAGVIMLVYRDVQRRIKQGEDRANLFDKRMADITSLHALLVGIIPGVPGGIMEDIGALKRREREMTAEILKMQIKFLALEQSKSSKKGKEQEDKNFGEPT